VLACLNQAQPFCYGRIDVPHNSATLLRDYLDVATTLAREAGSLALSHYQRGVKVERKPDQSPVTEADRGAEQLIRDRLRARFPEHAILGEEFGADKPAPRTGGSSILSTARAASCTVFPSSAS